MFKAKIVSLNDDRATLSFENGQSLVVSLSDIEGTPKLGAEVVLNVACLGSEDAGRTKLAQGLLNELLKG